MNFADIHEMVKYGNGIEKDICQICAIKNSEIVYEDCWRRFKRDSAVQVMSVTKGIMALLVGIAIDKGYIKSTKQKVLEFFPGYKVKRGEKTIYEVSIENLLTMTAPFKYRSEPWKKVCSTENWSLTTLDYLGGRAGITGEFRYVTLGLQILSGILENATAMKCIDFANEFLFEPLDIPARRAHTPNNLDHFSFMMRKKPRDNEWYADPSGTITAGWGLTMSAHDLAKIGWMLVCDGVYKDVRVLSREWISQMTTPILRTGNDPTSYFYGYLWYRPYYGQPIYAAIGTGGNLIYVNEETHIAVGVTGTSRFGMENNIGFIEQNVIPLIS